MSKNLTIHGEAMNASLEGTLATEQFLKDNYRFRFNVLNGKVEFIILPAGESDLLSRDSPASRLSLRGECRGE